MSQPSHLHCSLTRPYPVIARNDASLQEISDALAYFGHGTALADPDVGERNIGEMIQGMYAGHPQAVMAQWSDLYRSMHAAVCLTHARRGGTIIRATDALETLLSHTDIDVNLPTSLFQPPHPAIHIHFGDQWRNRIRAELGPALALSGATPEQTTVHGCYLLQTRKHCEGCKRTQRTIGLYLVVEFLDQPGRYVMCGGADEMLHDEDAPLTETLIHKLDGGVPGGLFGQLPATLVDLLTKLFLYMQTDGARIVRHDDLHVMQRRLSLVGSKKKGKLARQAERLYDWLEVGPTSLPSGWQNGAEEGEMSAHWRRGHLRQQACGPNHSMRKMIFVAPTIVRADKLQGIKA